MEASRPTSYYNPSRQYRKPIQQANPKFSGVLDGLSNMIGVVDSNRLLELMASDGIGMIVPRTALAYHKRGADDGRETFLREFSGLIGNVLITGWFGWGMLKVLGNRVNTYNPHGLALDAHINAANLNAFNQIYKKTLNETTDLDQVRRRFIQKILGGLQSDNPQFMWHAQREALNRLSCPEDKSRLLEKMLVQVLGKKDAKASLDKVQALNKENMGTSLNKAQEKLFNLQLKELGPELLAHSGKLSSDACDALAKFFEPKKALSEYPDGGTLNLDESAQARIAQWKEHVAHSDWGSKLKNEAMARKALRQARLDLYRDTKQATEAFTKLVDTEALNHGLTGTVHLEADGQRLSAFQSRKNVLRELKYYLEHFIDRATQDSGKDITQIESKLFNQANSGFLHQLLPKAEDGLITATVKHKRILTWVPITLSLCAAGIFTFYNQYITAQKHGGRMFFPGEGSLSNQDSHKKTPLLTPPPLHKNFQPVTGFHQAPVRGGSLS